MTDAPSRRCAHCGRPFTPYRSNQRFCPGGDCRRRAWEARHPRKRRPPKRVHTEPSRDKRVELYLEPEQLEALDTYQQVVELPSRSAAARRILEHFLDLD